MKHSDLQWKAVPAALAVLATVHAVPVHAHDAWVLMKDYALKPSSVAVVQPMFGHHFAVPGKDFLAPDKVAQVTALRPDGAEVVVVPNGQEYQTTDQLKERGSYVVLVKLNPGFYSKTPDGGVTKSKKEAPGAIDCRFSEKHAKALFTVGGPGGSAYGRVFGLPVELVPLQDPGGLKAGDVLEVKVLMGGKPVSTVVYGTYAGFSADKGTFAYATSTSKEGVARVKLLKGGTWLLLAKQDEPYRDPATCDKQAYAGSLTFQVR